MEQFDYYCTPEQTRKALELGAPMAYFAVRLEVLNDAYRLAEAEKEANTRNLTIIGYRAYRIPTQAQMIGWLQREKKLQFSIGVNAFEEWAVQVYSVNDFWFVGDTRYHSREELAISMAIDIALARIEKEVE